MTGRISVAPAVAGRTIRMRVCPVGPTGQTTSSICASASGIGCDCKSVRTLCAAAGLSWLSGGPFKLLMNACVVGSSVMEPFLCVARLCCGFVRWLLVIERSVHQQVDRRHGFVPGHVPLAEVAQEVVVTRLRLLGD